MLISTGQALFSVMESAKIWLNPSSRSIVVAVNRANISGSEYGLLQTEASVQGF